jgi:hypothetical protein
MRVVGAAIGSPLVFLAAKPGRLPSPPIGNTCSCVACAIFSSSAEPRHCRITPVAAYIIGTSTIVSPNWWNVVGFVVFVWVAAGFLHYVAQQFVKGIA